VLLQLEPMVLLPPKLGQLEPPLVLLKRHLLRELLLQIS
jgi:hypothetical protein